VEALFTWVSRKFTHRLPGTTKSTSADRGTYDSRGEAEKAGITLDVLEKWFIQAIVDAYMQEWDRERRGRRTTLWEESVQKMGVARYLGSPDDLKLLLMKAVNRKNPVTGRYAISPYRGLSFLGYRYVSPGLLDRLRGREIDIYFDRRDISVIYLFEEGERRRRSVLHRVAGGAFEHLGSASQTKERYRARERGQHDEPLHPPAYSARSGVWEKGARSGNQTPGTAATARPTARRHSP
jgi:hypothetical protein